jgi:hypothetical protein
MWDDEQIDAAIDETARQMTAGEPGGDFRARVMERIDTGSRGSVAGLAIRSWRPALAGLSLVAAVLATGLAVLREHPQPGRIASREVRLKPDATSQAKPEPPMVRLKPDPTYENNVAKANARGALEVAQGLSPAIAPDAVEVRLKPDATDDLDPLTTSALELESIAVSSLAAGDSIHIDPLPPVPSIAVTPLGVDNEGDRR